MQGVGSQVILALAIPFIVIIIAITYWWKSIVVFVRQQMNSEVLIEESDQARGRRLGIIEDNVCSICLMEPKKYRVSATCGHSFCGHCLLGLYVHEANKIKCPLCRQDITTIFKIFVEREPAEQIDPLIEQIRNYNRLFDDNRPLLRRVIELPYVLQRIRMYIFRIDFVIFFLRSVHVIRMLFLIIGYILIPFDLIPQHILGIIGYIDDIVLGLFLVCFFIAIAALQYRRHHGEVA